MIDSEQTRMEAHEALVLIKEHQRDCERRYDAGAKSMDRMHSRMDSLHAKLQGLLVAIVVMCLTEMLRVVFPSGLLNALPAHSALAHEGSKAVPSLDHPAIGVLP